MGVSPEYLNNGLKKPHKRVFVTHMSDVNNSMYMHMSLLVQ